MTEGKYFGQFAILQIEYWQTVMYQNGQMSINQIRVTQLSQIIHFKFPSYFCQFVILQIVFGPLL